MAKEKKRNKTTFILFMCWLVYSSSYLGKVNFSASKLSVINFFKVNEAEAGLVGTFFFFAYGVCMVLNGIFCKKYNVKYVVFFALITSSIINLSIAILPKNAFSVMKYLWLLNGVALSFLWPTLIRLLSETLPKNRMPSASRIMGTTVATGTFIIYGLSALFSAISLSYALSFIVPAVVCPTVAVLWLIFYNKFTDIDEKDEQEIVETNDVQNQKGKLSKNLLATICCLALFAVITNLVKDGLVGWVPKILKDSYGLPDATSILLTLALPLMGIIANFFTVWCTTKIKSFILLEGMFFLFGGIMVLSIIFMLSTDFVILTLAMMMATSLIASGSNNIITGIFPLYMKGKVNSGLIAGVLNGFCYLGSTLSDYGLGLVKVATGSWLSVFYVLLVGCGIVVLVSLVYIIVNGIKREKND